MFGKRILPAVLTAVGAMALMAQAPAPQPPAQTTTAEEIQFAWPETKQHPRPKVVGSEPQYIRPETPEQRKSRLGTPEDPGPNPDPNKHFWRFGKSYHIEKFDRRWEAWDVEEGFVRPIAFANVAKEVYQLNNRWLWVWIPDQTEVEVPTPPSPYNTEALVYLRDMRAEFSELNPKASARKIRFEEASDGLPNSGSWRNGLAVADMNGDGCPDIITPPERKGPQVPVIFLGDCKGHWHFWSEAKWPPHGLDYGNVVAADFNKDGHMDLAFGVHQVGIFVMLGDGKGNFTEVSEGLPRNFPTRRIAVADVDHDGYPDIVALYEGPGPGLRVYYNRRKGTQWEKVDVAGPEDKTAGDWLTVANLTGDRHPDMVAATIYENSNAIVFLSDGPKKWKPFTDPRVVPYLSSYSANAAGKFSSKKVADAIVSYVRRWPQDVPYDLIPEPPVKSIVGLDRISFAGAQPKRTPIVRWSGIRGITGMAVADFDGDGNLDILYTRYDPREAVILLGDGKGGFTKATIEGLKLEPNTNYDVTVADVNGDGKPDVILMYESAATTIFAAKDGSIHVFLNRGAERPATEARK